MAININQNVQSPAVKNDKVDQNIQKQQLVQQQQQAVASPAQRQDTVSLTAQAQQFSKAAEKASGSTGVDQEKVDKIKAAIAEGKYKVNVEQLARRIVQFEGDLFGRK